MMTSFVAMTAVYVITSLIFQGNPGSLWAILLLIGCGTVASGVMYLHFTNDMIDISESGIDTTGRGSIKWQDVSKVTIAKRMHARSQRVDTIICVFYGQKGMFKISSSPEETDQIMHLLKKYVDGKLSFYETNA